MDKNILKKFAIESRQDLMDKIRRKIDSLHIEEDFNVIQNEEVYKVFNKDYILPIKTKEEYTNWKLLLERIKELGKVQVIEEAAYTWFNRIVAIRYMEIHDYLPLTKDNQSLGIRVLSSKDNTPDPEILKFTNLTNPDLDIDFRKEKYADLKTDNEKFKYILLLVCKKLGKVIPQVFDGITDYIDILIPDNLLNDTGFVNKIVKEVPEDNFNEIEIIGWLYQYYISEKKDAAYTKLNKEHQKINKIDLPVVTQMFTPDWIVRLMVDNSLVSTLQNNNINVIGENIYPIASKKIINNIEKIKYCDLCCGSGHILLYVFNKLYEAYQILGYDKNNICEKIIKNNIFGLDIDNRAVQLSILSLLLNARKYDKNIFNKSLELNIYSIMESNNISYQAIIYLKNNLKETELKEVVDYIIEIYKNSKEYGSIIKIKKYDYILLKEELFRLKNKSNNIIELSYYNELINNFLPLINQSIVLSSNYDYMITNPPYRGIREVDDYLAEYLKKEYPNSKYDLYSVFLQKEYEMLKEDGYGAIIMPNTWLTIGSYGNFRREFLTKNKIETFFDFGPGIFGSDVGSVVKFISMIFKKTNKYQEYFVNYINYKENKFENKKYKFDINALPDYKIDFNLTENEKKCFKNSKKLENIVTIVQGMSTSDNDRFLRNWYEVNYKSIKFNSENENDAKKSNKKWFPYNKGGLYRKWYGNNGPIINYYNDGEEVKEFAKKLYKTSSRTIKNTKYFFKESITYTLISSKISARYSNKGFIFDAAGSSIFSDINTQKLILALLSTKVALRMLNAINNSYNKSVGDLKILPVIDYLSEKNKIIIEITNKNIILSKQDWDSFETSWDFEKHPLITEANWTPQMIANEEGKGFMVCDNMEESYNHLVRTCEEKFNNLKKNEEELNRIFIDIYGLQDELKPEESDRDVTIHKIFESKEDIPEEMKNSQYALTKLDIIKSFISYAVGCMFGRYSLDEDGLIFAGGDFNKIFEKYPGQALVDDNGQPLPGNPGGWAGVSLADYKYIRFDGKDIKLSYTPDLDNIIPITENKYFEDDIVTKFVKFVGVVYGKNTLEENLDFIANTLGKRTAETSRDTIRRYFLNDFYADHLKTYQKRPIYWLFDSGKKNGFKALIYMHRYNDQTVSKIRLDYLHKMQQTYATELKDVEYKLNNNPTLNEKKELTKKQADLNAKILETNDYDEKIAHIADQRISIDLDDGVAVNYAKFSVKNPKTGKDESILANSKDIVKKQKNSKEE